MSKRRGAVAMVFLAGLFLLLNRAAYKGYFQDDELDTLSWAPRASLDTFLKGAATPLFFANNFRPTGHFYFHALGRFFGLHFPPYVAVLQFLHLFNVWLMWMVARQLRAPPAAAFLACLFFAVHMALFDAFWKPMYVFDVLCATFCLLAILFWSQRRWVLSFIAFWLAYKAKELAVMLPAVLLCYEFWLGKRQWKPLIPFFLASLSFGLQGIFLNPNADNAYTFRFTFEALAQTSVYYAGRVFLIPYLGFLVPLAAIPGRNRRSWFGLAMAAILFFPLLFLPGRIFSPYCYVPFLGLALALSGVAEAVGPIPVAVLLLLFAPFDIHELRLRRNITLTHDNDVRGWVAGIAEFARTAPRLDAAVWSGSIPDFAHWGMSGAIYYLFHNGDIKIANVSDPGAADLLQHARVAYIEWHPELHRSIVNAHGPGISDLSFVDFRRASPIFQLEQGWFDNEEGYRWTAPVALARLDRPAGATRFSMHLLIGPDRLRIMGPVTLLVWLNGRALESRRFTAAGWQDVDWTIPAGPAGSVEMKLQADPPFRPATESRVLGIAVGAFGFPAR
jgi:hypothetical protein